MMESTRARILQKAGELFATRGYRAISMREIAAECGISKPAIYHHFQDKKHLYLEVLDRELERLVVALDEAGAIPGTAIERLSRLVRCYLEALHRRLSLLQLLFRDIGDLEGEIPDLANKRGEGVLRPFVALIQEGIARGEFRPVDATRTALSLVGMMNIFVTRTLLRPDLIIGEEDVLHTVDLALNGLIPR
ncbi:MAG: TetR/AcrR family transcriptional regulator [Chloroflexi bacterium]|nr:TetR/AcrR family transcriptional regulator [Chloroflexota bacterium]